MNTLLISLLICMILFPIGVYFIQKYNMNFYKLHGRSAIEIESWLKTRKWFTEFYDNIQKEILENYRLEDGSIAIDSVATVEIENRLVEVISGSLDKNTISCAFSWASTPEGTEYWGKREYEFLKWYFGQFIDLHLFK